MKHLNVILLLGLLFSQISRAQIPQKFSFQGAARDAAGKTIANRNVGVRFTIRLNTALGPSVYQETHSVMTNGQGVFTVSVGGGEPQSGQFDQIDWAANTYVLQLELAPDGNGTYVDLGTTQLLSVPYAIQADKAKTAESTEHAELAEESKRLINGVPIIQEGRYTIAEPLPTLQWPLGLSRLLWHPRKGAFRVGIWDGQYVWSESNLGDHSFAGGYNSIASDYYAFAYGSYSNAYGQNSVALGAAAKAGYHAVALGTNVEANGDHSISIGLNNSSYSTHSISIGSHLESRAGYSIVLGTGNDISDAIDNGPNQSQRLFQIGNGEIKIDGSRSNALTILRNGNVGIGNNVLDPTHILDVGHRMRLRSNTGFTAGLWLDNASHNPYSFIGGYDDDEMGVYFENGGWRFFVNANGGAWLAGELHQNSDLRLKQDLQPLSNSINDLYKLRGYHYHWKDKTRTQALQTGLIAQEVEAVFPELVESDKDGFKSVNYIGLIPHLMEAIKELKNENNALRKETASLSQETKRLELLERKLEQMEARMNVEQPASGN